MVKILRIRYIRDLVDLATTRRPVIESSVRSTFDDIKPLLVSIDFYGIFAPLNSSVSSKSLT